MSHLFDNCQGSFCVKNTYMRLFLLLCFALFLPTAFAEQITIAVASNFTAPMKEIINAYEQQHPHRIRAAFGSSGKFYAQIKHGAPYALFFSADQAKVSRLEGDGFVVPQTRFTYAKGTLVLWSSHQDFIHNSADVLAEEQFNKLALANPKLAPYGLAAEQVLDNLQLTSLTRSRWVQGENISQTYQFVRTANADLGFVALSQVMTNGKVQQGSHWLVPRHLYQPIKQDAALLTRAKTSKAAQSFLTFIQSQTALRIISAYGYQ